MLERLYCSRGTGWCFRHVLRDDTFFDMPRLPSLVAAAAAALFLTACASSPFAGEPATTPVAPGATAAAPLAPGEQPSFAFAGDCDSMITEAEIENLVGADVTPLSVQASGRASAVEVLGGLACGWGGGDYAWYVALTVIPAEGPEATIAEYSYPGGQDCWGQNEVGAEGACINHRRTSLMPQTMVLDPSGRGGQNLAAEGWRCLMLRPRAERAEWGGYPGLNVSGATVERPSVDVRKRIPPRAFATDFGC